MRSPKCEAGPVKVGASLPRVLTLFVLRPGNPTNPALEKDEIRQKFVSPGNERQVQSEDLFRDGEGGRRAGSGLSCNGPGVLANGRERVCIAVDQPARARSLERLAESASTDRRSVADA